MKGVIMQNDEIIGTSVAAKMLNLTQARVCQLCKTGQLASMRIGPVWGIKKQAVINYKSKYPKYFRK